MTRGGKWEGILAQRRRPELLRQVTQDHGSHGHFEFGWMNLPDKLALTVELRGGRGWRHTRSARHYAELEPGPTLASSSAQSTDGYCTQRAGTR